jgi:polyisoprenoid-binding protein YceI
MKKTIGAISPCACIARRLVPSACAILLGIHTALASAAAPAAPPAMPAVTAPPAGQYQIDKAHASLVLRVSHLGFSTYTTRFSHFDSDLTFDPRKIPASRVVTTIDASSFEMDAAPQMCLDIVKGAKFLDIAKYPKIVFTSGKVRMTGAKSFEIDGTLDLHGLTRPLVLKGTYNGGYAGMAGMDPHARVGFSAHGVIKRSDFGMTYGLPAPGTTMGVGDQIDVTIETEFTGPPLPPSAGDKH